MLMLALMTAGSAPYLPQPLRALRFAETPNLAFETEVNACFDTAARNGVRANFSEAIPMCVIDDVCDEHNSGRSFE
jgi:hypothetical protein